MRGRCIHGVHSKGWAELARVWCTGRVVPCNHCQEPVVVPCQGLAKAWCTEMVDQSRRGPLSQSPGPLLAGQQAILHKYYVDIHIMYSCSSFILPRIGIATSNILDKNIILSQQSDAYWSLSNPLLGNINCVFYTTLDYF